MEINKDLVNYLEKLARIELSSDEEDKVEKELGEILGYIDVLSELDTEGVEPMSHAFPVCNVYREDVVTNSDNRDAVLANAPHSKDGCFKVPKTVE
jgi:aspartyl-tRNA(Asn)/glutamyl-tRNA(Gln) amidotransferase subunit C